MEKNSESPFVPTQLQTTRKMFVRDVRLHSTDFERTFDDNELLLRNGCRNYKIAGVRIYINSIEYICGLQFSYLDIDKGKVIEGNAAIGYFASTSSKKLLFDNDEYVIGIGGRAGAILDELHFTTDKGKVHGFGGKGGRPFEYRLSPGYHMGAVSVCWRGYVNGLQFDYKKIPTGTKKEPIGNNGLGQLLEDYFESAIEYLSCREIMRLFLVSKSIAARRTTSERFWIKCLSLGDPCVLTYLTALMNRFAVPAMKTFFDLFRWRDIPIVEESPDNYKLAFTEELMQNGQSYLVVFKVLFKNYVSAMWDSCMLTLQQGKQIIAQSEYPENTLRLLTEVKAVYSKQLSFFVEGRESTRQRLNEMLFVVSCNHEWDDWIRTGVLSISANVITCERKYIREVNFKQLGEGIQFNAENRLNLKDI